MISGAPRIFAICAGIAVAAALSLGLMANGWPGNVRIHRFDQQRVTDLIGLSNAVERYRSYHRELPDSMATAVAQNAWIHDHDPETDSPYEFMVKGEKAYELCATFGAASTDPDDISPGIMVNSPGLARIAGASGYKGRWSHPAGRQCFDFETEDNPKDR